MAGMKRLVVLSLVTLSLSQAATAALITPQSINYVGTAVEFFPTEANLINGSGLSGTPSFANYLSITHANVATNNAWVTDDPAPGGGDYYVDAGNATVTFTLSFDQDYRFTDFVFWGYHFGAANSNEARQFKLDFSADGGTTFPSTVTVANPLGTYAVASADTLPLGNTFVADTIRLSILDNQAGGGAAGGDRVGIAELRMIGDAVPEPASAVGLGGLAVAGLLKRRRR